MSNVSVPISKVRPATAAGTAIGTTEITNLPPLTKSDWGKQDLSAPDAGRLESGRMLKKRVGKADRIDLEWSYISRTDAATVLQAFDHEYLLVTYLDAKSGSWVEKHFYAGDMAATGWLPHLDSWTTVSVPIIRATPDSSATQIPEED